MSGLYLRRSYLLPAELEDELVADLWEMGTLGVQVLPAMEGGLEGAAQIRLEAWFPEPSETEASDGWETCWHERGVQSLPADTVPESDWLALWRRGARPIPVGERLLLDPREPERAIDHTRRDAEASSRHWLRLPARRAFGTGSHETTRLALHLLEQACFERANPPRSVLDVGTGTGVLSFAALLFGVSRVVAYDVDPLAVFMARDNSRLNGFGGPARPGVPRFVAGTVDSLSAPGVFDLVLINVLPHLVGRDLPRILRCVAPGGALAVAGMLTEEGQAVQDRLATLGFVTVNEVWEGAWVGYRCERGTDS